MDREGFDLIQRVVAGSSELRPRPELGEDVRYVEIETGLSTPVTVLNWLERFGLMDAMSSDHDLDKPRLKLIGQSVIAHQRQGDRPTHFLTFEDMAHPGAETK